VSELTKALGLWGNIGLFVAAAVLILIVGSKLERWAEQIGRITKLGDVFAGMILLAISTSLPEVATSLTAALHGQVGLAVNNLLGGVVLQTMMLAIADLFGKRRALTGSAPSFGLLLQGVGLIVVLSTTAIAAGLETHWRERTWLADVGPAVIAAIYLLMQYIAMNAQRSPRWTPARGRGEPGFDELTTDGESGEAKDDAQDAPSLKRLLLMYAIGSLLVCIGGYTIVLSTEHIAESTGASQSFLGFTLVAFATSLPEIATTIAAARRGHGITAVSNIFGSNGFDVALLALVAVTAGGPMFADALVPTVFAAALGVLVTAIYLIGLLERQDRTIVRMGWDSVLVLALGFGGIAIMFALGPQG
jgi:cation:H+ antiporter